MFYLRVKGTKNEFMKKNDLFGITNDLSEAESYEQASQANSRKRVYKATLGTVERTKRFDVVEEEVARYGINR
ncbi:hypothetical protein FEZ51_02030 [Pediococcus stilesii]|uniref:Uncharacterized protein n=1 Tax=Pediococcus stilesii TaxID=331679 RepID=A0A5R9BZ91_9LACO|nr:hypothetical protein [Pediococcus stilesii]TLQ05460.1 hypothetical protein FEZ51_02030 [Pediococcus stilesii]